MRSIIAVLYVVFVALSLPASTTTVPISKIHPTRSLQSTAQADGARASFLLMQTQTYSGAATVPITDFNYSGYTANIGVGTPPTYYSLIIDTGSSNTFVGTGKPYVQTSSSVCTGENFNLTYGTGSASGVEYIDTVTIAPNIVIKNQSIGDVSQSASFDGFDGILGAGPVDLTYRSVTPNQDIPTVMNNAVQQGLISKQILAVSFAPSTAANTINDTNGVMTFGATDPSYYTGDIAYTPLTQTTPSSNYWGINTTMMYGSEAIISTSTAGIVDTGTTLLLLSDEYYQTYLNSIPGAYFDNATGAIAIPDDSVQNMKSFTIQTGDITLTLDAAAQLFPEQDNTGLGGTTGLRYGIVNSLGNLTTGGLEFIIGMTVMQRFYTVFDTDSQRVGFAYTNHTFSP